MHDTPLKTLGLIGGMSWESTLPYYREINETVQAHLGGLHSAKIILYSVDFHEIEQLQQAGDWDGAGSRLAGIAQTLERAGSDALMLCTNTMHKVAPAIEASVQIPLLHIADPTAQAIKRSGHSVVGLLGTRFTMEQDFYRDRLQQLGLHVLTPDAPGRELVHRVIYEELCCGKVRSESRQGFVEIIAALGSRGAQAIILGCTEISMLVQAQHCTLPLFDTTALHARSAARWAMSLPQQE